jgi:predicted TIM-barrel fold metal-dependent hydrolase
MADYKLISADSHVNEVAATWERVRRKYGERAPEIVWNPSEREPGPYLSIRDWETSLEGKNRESCAMEFVGMVIGGLGIGSVVGRTSAKAGEFRKNFRFEDWAGPWEPNARLKDMDRDGVEVDILYASHLRHIYGLSIKDEPFFRAIAQSYNDWLMEYCSVAPNRLVGLPVLSILNLDGAVEDLTLYAKQGAKGFMIASSTPIGMNYGESKFDSLWAAAQDADVPLCLHTTTGAWKKAKFHHPRIRTFIRGEGEIQTSLLEMIYGGVFDRFPRLKIVAAEWDIGWVAHMVAKLKDHDPKTALKLAPADYFRRNIWFTFENDRAGVLTTPLYGADRFLWASDYPHGATTWPDSQQIVDQQFDGISEETKHKVTRQNAIDLYKLAL